MTGPRILAVACVALALLIPSLAWATHDSPQGVDTTIPVGIGELVKVSGAPLGCAVRRDSGRRVLDCRRLGRLMGTYGVLLTRERLTVVRFRNARHGTVVFSARHRSVRAHTCEGGRS